MSIEIKVVEKKENVYLVQLQGSIDSQTYKQLDDKLRELISDNTKAVVFDFEGVEYISSAGIGAIMWAKNTLEDQYASFSMVNLKPKIKKIFDVMKLLPIMNIFEDMPQAYEYIDQIINEEMEREDV